MNLWNFIIYWLPPLAWMVIISPTNKLLNANSTSHFFIPVLKWLFPHADQTTIDLLHIGIRKFFHFFNYALLTILICRAFRGKSIIWRPQWVILAGMIAIGYGALDEYVQNFIPSRTGSLRDWLIDSSGVVCVLSIVSARNTKKMG